MIQDILEEKIIRRSFYIDNLKKYLDSQVIKVLTGMRRVGKSFVLKSFIQELFREGRIAEENVFYMNKEDLEFDYIKDYNDLNKLFNSFLKNIDKDSKIFIGIDEVQEIDGWERFVNSALSKYQSRAEIFITGSNSNMLSSELSTLITGRYIEFEIFPLSLGEYSVFSGKKVDKKLFLEYLKYGGLPGIFFMNKEDLVIFNYLKGVYSTILIKDIVKHFGLRNIDFFENLYKYIFSNVGNIFSAKSISDYLRSQRIKISPETVLNYLDYGLKVFLLNLVKASDPDTKKYFEIYNKYYSGDLGLRNALVGYDFKRDVGRLIENYVFLELKRNGYNLKIGRLKSGKEVDFIAEKNGVIKYFQVCYLLGLQETMDREYSSLKEIKDNWEKYVVSFDDMDFGIHEGIKHVNVLELDNVL